VSLPPAALALAGLLLLFAELRRNLAPADATYHHPHPPRDHPPVLAPGRPRYVDGVGQQGRQQPIRIDAAVAARERQEQREALHGWSF
jgi:hypothetical protein